MTQTKICRLINNHTVPKDIVDNTMKVLNKLDSGEVGNAGLNIITLRDLYNYSHDLRHEFNSEAKELLRDLELFDDNYDLPLGAKYTANAAIILFNDIPCTQDPILEIIGLDAKL
jgi:hypothetical protein